MKKISASLLSYVAASHENQDDPGALKKVLFTSLDFPSYVKLQMINWAHIDKGKSFVPHYHQDMDEVFIIISGKVRIIVNDETDILEKGDAVLVSMGAVHRMENIGPEAIDYIVIGVSLGKGGKTIISSKNS